MNEQNLVETYQDGKVVFDGKIIRLEHWNVQLPNGTIALREVACHPGASAVVALDEDNNIILVQQYRAPVGRLTLEIPAGKLDYKLISVVDCDPRYDGIRELEDLSPFVLKEIANFFANYKVLQGIKVEVGRFHNAQEALQVIEDCKAAYMAK